MLRGKRHALSRADREAYLSFLNPKGRVILDVGATDGDVADLCLAAGATRIICIERDRRLAARIRDPRCEVHAREFYPEEDLADPRWDAAKIDVEGYEAEMLPLARWRWTERPILVEVHTAYLISWFERAGFERITEPTDEPRALAVCLMGRG